MCVCQGCQRGVRVWVCVIESAVHRQSHAPCSSGMVRLYAKGFHSGWVSTAVFPSVLEPWRLSHADTLLCCAVLCYAMLCYSEICYAILRYAMPCPGAKRCSLKSLWHHSGDHKTLLIAHMVQICQLWHLLNLLF